MKQKIKKIINLMSECGYKNIGETLIEEVVKEYSKKLKKYVNAVKNDYYDYRDMLKKIERIAENILKLSEEGKEQVRNVL